MPVPLRLNYKDEAGSPLNIDYSFLCDQMQSTTPKKNKTVTASNKDASLIMELWAKGERVGDNETFKVNQQITLTKRDIARLSARGFIKKCDDGMIKLTNRGKIIVMTMALAEPNQFQIRRRDKNYNEILAGMSKADKLGYRMPKFATNQSNNIRLSS